MSSWSSWHGVSRCRVGVEVWCRGVEARAQPLPGRLSSVKRYDPALDAWEAVAPMAMARHAPAVAVLDGKLYAVGGCDNGFNALSSVERYDPALNAWEAVAPMAAARRAPAVAVLECKL